jgi:hypothetical protein
MRENKLDLKIMRKSLYAKYAKNSSIPELLLYYFLFVYQHFACILKLLLLLH